MQVDEGTSEACVREGKGEAGYAYRTKEGMCVGKGCGLCMCRMIASTDRRKALTSICVLWHARQSSPPPGAPACCGAHMF